MLLLTIKVLQRLIQKRRIIVEERISRDRFGDK
jgi:hypothetical protein